jgi:rsbT antagonist protein RsbS
VLVGMRPAVAITLVELGLTLPGVHTALSTEVAMELLRQQAPSSRFGGLRQESQ